MSTVNIYEMAQTWNNGAVAFTAIQMNVTDTASDAASLLMDLQVGGTSKFSVSKAGKVSTAGYFEASRGTSTGYYLFGSVFASQDTSNNRGIYLNGGQILGRTSAFYGGRLLIQSADHVVSIGDGANAQTFNIYNTYTDASNYERGFLKWASNSFELGTEKDGTGSTRNIFVRVGGTRSAIFSNTYVQFDVDFYPTQNIIMAAKYTEMSEMTAPAAPATNKVRIYAEDNGAGKTRLMALFPTGAAQQIAIEP